MKKPKPRPMTTRRSTTPIARKPLAAKEIKLGSAKAKMVGGIIAVPAKPKKKMY